MALLVPNEGEQEMLQRILDVDVKLKLFTNDKTPEEIDVLGDYTEATAAGYAEKILASASWSHSLDAGDALAEYAEQDFVFTAGETVYGYFVTDNAGTKILWVERFTDAPYVIPAGGGTIKITPKIKLQ